jgi:two-component system sensor histidine kinase CiaH
MHKILDRVPLKLINYIYWFLLLYLLAALAWWYIELMQQNEVLFNYQQSQIAVASNKEASAQLSIIQDARDRNAKQYLGEGLTFMIITLIGAMFIYGVVRRQISLQMQQQNFMMAVTHELKTPIAATKLSLETLKRHKLDEVRQNEIITGAINETERLNALCNNILLSSQLESGGYTVTKYEFDFSAMVASAVAEFKKRYPMREIDLKLDEKIVFHGEEFLIRLVLNNLLENAVKYTPATMPLKVELLKQPNNIDLLVKDQGPGIPDAEKEKIFEKFYRIGNELTRTSKGTGLGLYLSSKIIKDHHGKIALENNLPSGSVFKITLPI